MAPPDDQRDLEAGLPQMNRRLDAHQRAAEDDDLPVIGKPRLRGPGRRQIADGKDPPAGRACQDTRQIRFPAVGENQAVVGERLSRFEEETPRLAIQGLRPNAGPDREERIIRRAREEELLLRERPDHELGQERPVITHFPFGVDQRHGPVGPCGPAGHGGLETGDAAAND